MTSTSNTLDIAGEGANALLCAELLERLRALDYLSFERIVLRLLAAMGYENVRPRGRKTRSRNRDCGADIEAIVRTGITLAKALAQAKQYTVPVQAKYVSVAAATSA